MIVIGIDPGLTGALALVKDGELVEVHDLPTLEFSAGKVKRKIDAVGPTNVIISGGNIDPKLMERIIDRAREIGVERIFCLTFQTEFFGRHGFVEIHGTPVDPEVYQQLLRSYDAGVAEFLDLESVKPNTLGNTRMLLNL